MTALEIKSPLSNYRWIVLFTSIFAFIMYAYALQSVPPLIQQFRVIFNVDEASTGLLMSMVVIPGIILALPAGVLISKYSYRSIGFLSVLTIAAGSMIMASTQSFPVALLARFIIGFGGGLISVGAPTIVPQWFHHNEMGKSMAIYALGMPIATTAAFFTVPVLAQNFGWQSPFIICAVVSVVSAMLFLLTVRDGPLKDKTTAKFSDAKQALVNREIWKVSLVWMMFNVVSTGFLTWSPYLFFNFKGLTQDSASIVASLIMIANFFFVPFYGWASDKLGRRKPFIIAGITSMGLSLYLIVYANGISLPASVVVLGAAAGAVPPLVMAVIAQNLPLKSAGMGFGLVTFWQNIGIMLSAPLFGFVVQSTQSLAWAFFGMSIFGFIGGITALTIRSK